MDINQKSINYLKALAAETVSNAGSGHTGSAISASPILYALFNDHLNFNPADPEFANRDRFVMSAGHVSALLYSTLHLFGYDISIADLKKFRTCGSKTPGHPEYDPKLGIETTTGPLGQGVANAIGMAIGETMLASKFNTKDCKVFDHYTYCYCGDGCLMEGVAVEACSLAGTLGLNKMILLYDDNNITIDGARTLANNDDTAKKFEAMGWNVIVVKNGNDYSSCTKAIAAAKKSNKPTIVIFKTTIGIGTSKEGSNKIHAYPLPAEELAAFKQTLDINTSFEIAPDVYDNTKATIQKNIQTKYNTWKELLNKYKTAYPELYKSLVSLWKPKAINYEKILKALLKEQPMAGRDYSASVLNIVSELNPAIVGGNADLIASTKAHIKTGGLYSKENPAGRTICFGIREHSMGAISNGLALYLKTPVFDSTFTMFSNYMLPAIRMRAMMGAPVLSILTHDSIDIGQDGATHQPIETLPTLRAIPRYTTYRPATPAEVVAGYKLFLESLKPTALVLSKNKLYNFENSTVENAEKGGYVIYETPNPEVEIFASGTDTLLAIKVAEKLIVGARVISMPCESIFANQDKTYKNKVLLKNPKLKVAIEASNDNLWYKYVGENGLIINVTDYQTSGNGGEVYKSAGFDADKISTKIEKLIKNS